MKKKIILAIFCILIINAVAPISSLAYERKCNNKTFESSFVITLNSGNYKLTEFDKKVLKHVQSQEAK